MKIAIINISDRIGGSALAAWRTGETLQAQGHEVKYIVRNASVQRKNIVATRTTALDEIFEKYFSAALNLLGLQYLFLPISPKRIRTEVSNFQPDVIWLNNPVGGYFNLADLTKLQEIAPVVWTMHDMWAFTASGAHTMGQTQWKELKACPGERKIYPTIGLPLGNFLLGRKHRIYKQAKPTFVAPSRWLFELASTSAALQGQEITYLTHGLDLKCFCPGPKATARSVFNIPAEVPLIMFSAQKLSNNFFKGGNDLKEILDELERTSSTDIHVLLLGDSVPDEFLQYKKLKIHSAGYIREEEKIVSAYRAADLLLYPTRADNMPLVLMEATACGLPAITFNIGGCPEIVENNKNGFVFESGNNKAAAQQVISLLKDKVLLHQMSTTARALAEQRFDINTQAAAYTALFEKKILSWNKGKKH